MKPTIDQKEAVVKRDQLALHAASLRGIAQNLGETVQAPALAADDVIENIEVLETHCRDLETKISGLSASRSSIPASTPALAQSPGIADRPAPVLHRLKAMQSEIASMLEPTLDERCAQVASERNAKRQHACETAATLLADVKAGKLTLDAAIKQAKAQK